MQIYQITVAQGSSINEAIAKVPEDGKPLVITLKEGVYTEKVVVERSDVTFLGAGRDKTRITFSDAARTNMMGTFASASCTVKSPNFRAEHLTFANDFDYPSFRHLVENDPGKVKGLQAVALRTTEDADSTVFKDCAFFGYQDTLLLDSGVHLLTSCQIEGTIDFIFGAGTALFQDCVILSNGKGYVAAPSTPEDLLGFCFYQCKFLRRPEVPDHSVYLGRPWHPKADPCISSFCLLYRCYQDEHIHQDGWTAMHAFPPEGGEVFFTPAQSRFYESCCNGPGASLMRENLDESLSRSVVRGIESLL
ncbi:MAG: pectinesterase family protein [Sphaerochaeta sp.]